MIKKIKSILSTKSEAKLHPEETSSEMENVVMEEENTMNAGGEEYSDLLRDYNPDKSASESAARGYHGYSSGPDTDHDYVLDRARIDSIIQDQNICSSSNTDEAEINAGEIGMKAGQEGDKCLTLNGHQGRNDDSAVVKVCHYSGDLSKVWRAVKSRLVIDVVKPLDINTPIRDTHVRFVCLSDTHSKIEKLDIHSKCSKSRFPHLVIPDGDVLLHAGDFTNLGEPLAVDRFNTFLGSLPHRKKIVIAGNHELSFDENCWRSVPTRFLGGCQDTSVSAMKGLLTNCIYLEDSYTHVYGIKVYGSPWQPEFRQWAFNVPRGQPSLDIWNKIPSDTEVLMTHGPPMGYGDCTKAGVRVGCLELLNTVQKRVKPQYHVFGHIHEGYGVYTDGITTYMNASTCTNKYWPINRPIIFDIPLKEGFTK